MTADARNYFVAEALFLLTLGGRDLYLLMMKHRNNQPKATRLPSVFGKTHEEQFARVADMVAVGALRGIIDAADWDEVHAARLSDDGAVRVAVAAKMAAKYPDFVTEYDREVKARRDEEKAARRRLREQQQSHIGYD